MSNADISKTLNIIALALLIGYCTFRINLLLYVVLVLLILIAFPNPISGILAKGWLKFSEFIGHINSNILLTLVYFVVLVPVASLYRVSNKKMVVYFDGRLLQSCFQDSGKGFSREMFEKTW